MSSQSETLTGTSGPAHSRHIVIRLTPRTVLHEGGTNGHQGQSVVVVRDDLDERGLDCETEARGGRPAIGKCRDRNEYRVF